ncbi:MAG TPA: phenylalanine--tRNA ligase subunit beta, partial [Oscillospiraceae bacterium]|nr:phenylalanine--tRNA ligase subunit beta [Oscillospiraceae bacterium]
VDITNYVMLEYGQPMHAFDYEYVHGGTIVVRRAGNDTSITTLDGTRRTLTPDMLVIADETRPVGLAGVMGGENSEITDGTTRIVFESANFSGVSIRRTALALGLRTDASSRFEKGLDARNTLPAVQRACELVELLGAGEVVGGIIDADADAAESFTLALAPGKINRLLGTSLTEAEMVRCLMPLGFTFEGGTMAVPSWRPDVRHYSDVAEEVARMYGYDKIPTTLMRGETTQGGYSDKQRAEALIGSLCRGMGYSEILTYSFVSPSCFDKIRLPADSPLRKALTILNPLGEDTSIMRTSALPSLLETLGRNFSYRNKATRLYELATVYLAGENGLADERTVLSLGGYGDGMDFFVLKGAVEAVLSALRVENVRWEPETENPSFHPGRCARIVASGKTVGVLGQVHPLAEANYGIGASCCAAQLDLPLAFSLRAPEKLYQPLPRFPSVSRDIAVVCDRDIPVSRLEDCIARGAKGLLREIALFDVYTGQGVSDGKKSVAFSLTLRADDRTLSAAEADEDVSSVLALLERELGAVLR